MGQKIKGLEVDVEAVNVLTFIDKFETIMPNIRKVYEYLSEYSHPNWSGTMYLYSVINHKEVWVDLGKDADRYEGLKLQGLHALNAILVLFQVIYEDIDKSLPNFIKQCVTANNKGK